MNIKNTLIIAAVTGSLASVNAGAAPGDSSPSTQEGRIPRIFKRITRQQKDGLPSPGIYKSMPYSCIVVVPESVDPSFEYISGADSLFDFVITPDTHLEPCRPDR